MRISEVLPASFMDSPCWEGVSTKSGLSRTNPMRFLLSINQPSVEWQCMHVGDNDNASMPNLFLLSLLSFGHLGFVTSETPRSTVSSWVFQPPWAPRFMFQSINQSQSFNQSLLLIPLPWIGQSSRYSVAATLLTVMSPIAYWWIGCTQSIQIQTTVPFTSTFAQFGIANSSQCRCSKTLRVSR